MADHAPACDECDLPLAKGKLRYFCDHCDRDEATVLAREDEEYVRRAEEEYEKQRAGCTCDDYGDFQCDVHGPAVIAAQREAHERGQLSDAVDFVRAMDPDDGRRWVAELIREGLARRDDVGATAAARHRYLADILDGTRRGPVVRTAGGRGRRG